MGLIWGLFSVIIASVAQLSLGFAASHLPPMTHLWDFIAALLAFGLDARILLLGLLGYLLSVFCWYELCAGMDCFNGTSRLGRDFFAESTTGSSLYYERVDADFPAHDKTTLLSFPCHFTLPFPLIGAITACREDFHRMQLFTINTIKRILQRRE